MSKSISQRKDCGEVMHVFSHRKHQLFVETLTLIGIAASASLQQANSHKPTTVSTSSESGPSEANAKKRKAENAAKSSPASKKQKTSSKGSKKSKKPEDLLP